MVKTLHFPWRGYGFDSWSGNYDPMCRVVRPKKKPTVNKQLDELPEYELTKVTNTQRGRVSVAPLKPS